jgi:hypothetical protein
MRRMRRPLPACLLAVAALVGGCADQPPAAPPPRPEAVRAQIEKLLPAGTPDAAGWAVDIYAAFAALRLEPSVRNLCAVVAVAQQESGLQVNPPVPDLGRIAREEIDRRASKAGVPTMLVHAALELHSPDGRSYADRIDAAKTEKDLSDVFEALIDRVPLGHRLFEGYNPVHTAGPMQVGIDFAQRQLEHAPYPYPMAGTVRDELFTRRGGLYFGIAHLLDYPAPYERDLYRFADFNAGRYASRDAAFQAAVSAVSGIPLALDGDLVAHGDDASRVGPTELALRSFAPSLGMDDSAIRHALERGDREDFDRTALYEKVFALAQAAEGKPLPRAIVPRIALASPKLTHRFTTERFAKSVDDRQRRCMARAG